MRNILFSRKLWYKWCSHRISCLPALATALRDLEDLLITDKPPLTPPTNTAAKKNATPEPYNRARYYAYAANKTETFKDLYKFCFALAKPPYVTRRHHVRVTADIITRTEGRGILIWRCVISYVIHVHRLITFQTALAFWSVLVLPRYTIMQDIQDFINVRMSSTTCAPHTDFRVGEGHV